MFAKKQEPVQFSLDARIALIESAFAQALVHERAGQIEEAEYCLECALKYEAQAFS